ncbi:unnamed protein product [Lactuca virosa]|uniref:Uncharacterized protein n=1 Tax=Lactuca virosa TaxID=75947 RepID=A0AAU9PWM3_9ASTR|nr:unnamed protein product [Lactuca virosa]
MSTPPSLTSLANRTMDQDNPYNLENFHDHNYQSLSDVQSLSTSVTGNQTFDAASQLPSFQALARHQENSQKHMDTVTEYDLYGQPPSIGSIENPCQTSQPTADGIYEGYDLPPSKTDIRPVGSSVTGTTTADQIGAPQPFGQMSMTSKAIKNSAPHCWINRIYECRGILGKLYI